jgi:hypothetical protein
MGEYFLTGEQLPLLGAQCRSYLKNDNHPKNIQLSEGPYIACLKGHKYAISFILLYSREQM